MKKQAERLRLIRVSKGMSQENVAKSLDITVGAYSKIERGETELTISKLEKISQVLGIDLAQLLSFDSSQIFNISGNQNVQAVAPKAQNMNFYADDYKEKYIAMLELENSRLKEELKNCKTI